jgi:hypothetical protein
MTTAHQGTRSPHRVRAIATRACTRPRRSLSWTAAAAVLQRARFTVTDLPDLGVMLAVYSHAGQNVTAILSRGDESQYVLTYRRDASGPLPPMVSTGRLARGEWRWHDLTSAVRRALAEAHLLGAVGGVR